MYPIFLSHKIKLHRLTCFNLHKSISVMFLLFSILIILFFLSLLVIAGNSAAKTETSTLSSHDTKEDGRDLTRPSRPAVSPTFQTYPSECPLNFKSL